MMLHVIKSPARAFDMIVDAEPWAIPYREALRGRLADPSGPPADEPDTPAIEGFEAARRRASIARWEAGADTWRRWTQRIGALRARFQAEAGAERLLAWLGFADFSDHSFADAVDFGTLQFPAAVSFARASFAGDAWFADVRFRGRADFGGAHFLRRASFENSRFEDDADFRDVAFAQEARFTAVHACQGMTFRNAKFSGDAWFRYSQFLGPLDLSQARIGGEAGFGNCLYAGDVDISAAEFRDNAGFEQSIFSGKVSFARASFGGRARFTKSSFQKQPLFAGARFLGTSHFDETSMPHAPSPVAEQLKALERGLRPLLPQAGEGDPQETMNPKGSA
jgi:hypothetical protein